MGNQQEEIEEKGKGSMVNGQREEIEITEDIIEETTEDDIVEDSEEMTEESEELTEN